MEICEIMHFVGSYRECRRFHSNARNVIKEVNRRVARELANERWRVVRMYTIIKHVVEYWTQLHVDRAYAPQSARVVLVHAKAAGDDVCLRQARRDLEVELFMRRVKMKLGKTEFDAMWAAASVDADTRIADATVCD
jgi:hypothetical protein